MTSGPEGGRPHHLVVPDERPEVRWARWRRRLLVVAALAAVGAGAYQVWGDAVRERVASSGLVARGQALLGDRGPEAGTGSADTVSATAGAEGSENPAPPAPPPRIRELREKVDELSRAIDRFMERRSDHRLGRIGCSELARGYAAVDRAMVELARVYVDVRDRLEPGGERAFRDAMDRADSASRAFDDTGCERVP